MKIIGITVGTTTPKPNFEQTDPTKGDYIRGDIVSAIPTDTTLTQEGHIADAKSVGDALAAKQPLGDYALKSDIPTDYLTEIPSEYVTETDLDAKGYLTQHQDLSSYATKQYIQEYVEESILGGAW